MLIGVLIAGRAAMRKQKATEAAEAKKAVSEAAPVAPSASRTLRPGMGKHGHLPPAPPDQFKGLWNQMAIKCGFEDLWELNTVQGYLALNGKFSIVEVSKKGMQEVMRA